MGFDHEADGKTHRADDGGTRVRAPPLTGGKAQVDDKAPPARDCGNNGKKWAAVGAGENDVIEQRVAGGGVGADGKALLAGADGTDRRTPPVAGRPCREKWKLGHAGPAGNADNEGLLAGGGGEHVKEPPHVGAGGVDDDAPLFKGEFAAEDGKTVPACGGHGTENIKQLLMSGDYDAADPPRTPAASCITVISDVPAGCGANAGRAPKHVDSGGNVDNTASDVDSGLLPTTADGGLHIGTPPRAGSASLVDNAAPL